MPAGEIEYEWDMTVEILQKDICLLSSWSTTYLVEKEYKYLIDLEKV